MTIKSSGSLSFTEITNEFGSASSISLSKYYGLDEGIPNSGPIKFSDFYGKIINATRTIGTTQNFNARSDFTNATIVGGYKSTATVNSNNQAVKYYITSNGIVGSNSTGSTAFDTGSFPSGSTIYLVNNNYIVGAGGNGGNANNGQGEVGGPALTLRLVTFITNNGTIGGGGGGGKAGGSVRNDRCQQTGCCQQQCWTVIANGGGGGGGAGSIAGSGGSGGSGGLNGSLTTGGGGGNGEYRQDGLASATGGSGGAGGDLGQQGGNGGASGGNYIVNSGFATWLVTGTRLGGVG